MRDLRSYKQRPAIKLSKLIETICRYENSGYNVILDDKFFTEDNPYWNDTFVMLPLLGTEEEEDTESMASSITQIEQIIVGRYNGVNVTADESSFSTESTFDVSGGYIDLSNAPDMGVLNIGVEMKLELTPEDTSAEILYPSIYVPQVMVPSYGKGVSYTAQLLIYDTSNQIVGYSNLYNFTNHIGSFLESRDLTLGPSDWVNYTPDVKDALVTTVKGHFKKINGKYYFTDSYADKIGTYKLSINNWVRTSNKIKLVLKMRVETTETGNYDLYKESSYSGFGQLDTVKGYVTSIVEPEFSSLSVEWESRMISNFPVKKKQLLKTDRTPADFLLSYSKLFGLYFVKDTASKTINIYNRNNFFKDEVINIEDRIDYSKDTSITPILFDKK
jgi:hypothetical protein